MSQTNTVRGAKVDRKCECCHQIFTARKADVDRGWARFCSKRCKAIEQEGRSHQYREQLRAAGPNDGLSQAERDFEAAMDDASTTHGQDPGDAF